MRDIDFRKAFVVEAGGVQLLDRQERHLVSIGPGGLWPGEEALPRSLREHIVWFEAEKTLVTPIALAPDVAYGVAVNLTTAVLRSMPMAQAVEIYLRVFGPQRSHQSLAQGLGRARESVSKVVADLRREGLVETHYGYVGLRH